MESAIQLPSQVSFIPVDQLAGLLQSIIRQEVRAKLTEELEEKLLAPKEVCKLFVPNISLVTLDSWSDKGLLTKHYLGGRTYYKYSEVRQALKTIKKYTRK